MSESKYEKLRSSAETLNMSVPNFVKKKAHGSRLVAPRLDKETRQSIAKDLSKKVIEMKIQGYSTKHIMETLDIKSKTQVQR